MSAFMDRVLQAEDPQRWADVQANDILSGGVSAEEKAALLQPIGPVWPRLTEAERRTTLHAMVRFGGGFVARLGEAWQRADSVNAARLGCAFDDFVRAYGPGTPPHAAARRVEAS